MESKSWGELKAMEPVEDHDGHLKEWLTILYAKGDKLKEKANAFDTHIKILTRLGGMMTRARAGNLEEIR